MDTTTNEVLNQVETSESTNELESTNEPMEKNEVHELETTNEPMLKNEVPSEVSEDAETQEGDSGDDFGEIDLSAIEVATEVLDQINSSFKTDESLDNIMNACSSTAQALKQTIVDVLKCRENIVIAAGDSSNELETTLNEKLADFKNVVSGCYIPKDPKTDLTNIKHPAFSNVIITEVNETEDSNLDASSTSPVINEEESKQSSDSCTSDVSELNEDSKPFKQSSDSCTSDVSELNADSKPFKQSSDSCISDVSELNQDSKPLSKTQKDSEKDENYSNNKGSSKEVKSTKMPIIQSEAVPVSNSSEDDKNFKKQQKYNSNKKKGEKTSDQILKSLANCSTTEEKLQTLCKRHVETLEEYRLLEPRMKQLERQVSSQQREKEQLQAEHNRMILAKSRLESLCRELQKQNKAVKEESLLRIKEEEERRKEIASKFQATLNDISMLMQENAKKNMQLREENAGLAKKLKALVDHYDMWEKHMEKVVQQNNLEAQLAKAKYAKVNLLLKQETEKFLREKQALLENMSELQKKCTLLTSNELKLRTELGDYTSKYEEFQSVLNKSSQVFASFKTDMEATSKKIKKLEKETNVYKQKWESSNNALLGMINDKQKHDKELANAQQRIITLEKLCRALQAERNELQNQLNIVSGTSSKKDVPSTSAEAQA